LQKVNKIGAIVLGGHVQGLGIVRILGREKIPVILIDNTLVNLARHSKYCLKFFKVEDKYLFEFLKNLGIAGHYNKWIIFPTNDLQVKILSQNKSDLESYFRISTDKWDVVKLFYNKRETYLFAKKINITIPQSYFPSNVDELESLEIVFPCIIKPAVMHDFYKKVKKKVFVCKNLKELRMNYIKALHLISSDEIIVQEIVSGSSKNQFSACFLFLNGKIFAHLTACRMRQHPLDFGNATTYAETVDIPELTEKGEKILKSADYNGICEVEFKLDENDGDYKLLEINPRTWKWHAIANKAGVSFLKTYYDYLCGLDVKPIMGFNKASFIHRLTDFPVQLELLLKGYSFWKRRINPSENAVWANDDTSPWIFEKIYLIHFMKNR